ncbi:glycoside hydrolase family 3 C-terminal domain-containing protein [Cryptosporangium minutisporangium]
MVADTNRARRRSLSVERGKHPAPRRGGLWTSRAGAPAFVVRSARPVGRGANAARTAPGPLRRRTPRPPAPVTGLQATFYPSADFSGSPVKTQTTPTVDFTGAPTTGLPQAWSARWTGTLTPTATGTANISTVLSGSVKVTIGGKTVIDGDRSFSRFQFGPETYPLSGQVPLTAGKAVPITVEYSTVSAQGPGYFGPELHLGWQPTSLIPAAVEAAKKADVAIVYVNQSTGEGMDRDSYDLPGDQNQLIDAVATANPRTVVVLNTPGAVLMPWLSKVQGVLQAWYPGVATGTGPASVLFGDADPGGRLPVSFPASNSQRPVGSSPASYPGTNGTVTYDEDVFVGYQYLRKAGRTPLFPFGYGLSYTTFSRDAVALLPLSGDPASVRLTVKNTGSRAGTDVTQVSAGPLPGSVPTPDRRLVGYAKTTLAAGDSKTITIAIPKRSLSYWDSAADAWVTPKGAVPIYVGSSVSDAKLAGTLSTG